MAERTPKTGLQRAIDLLTGFLMFLAVTGWGGIIISKVVAAFLFSERERFSVYWWADFQEQAPMIYVGAGFIMAPLPLILLRWRYLGLLAAALSVLAYWNLAAFTDTIEQSRLFSLDWAPARTSTTDRNCALGVCRNAFTDGVGFGLNAAGEPIGYDDLFIAAQAMTYGMILVTANERVFSKAPGLIVENWLK